MIRIENVTKKYRGSARPALNQVSLEIDKGEFVFLVGASGSGKSSLISLMLREEVPTKGSVHVLGEDLVRIPSRRVPYFRRKLGVVFKTFACCLTKRLAKTSLLALRLLVVRAV